MLFPFVHSNSAKRGQWPLFTGIGSASVSVFRHTLDGVSVSQRDTLMASVVTSTFLIMHLGCSVCREVPHSQRQIVAEDPVYW